VRVDLAIIVDPIGKHCKDFVRIMQDGDPSVIAPVVKLISFDAKDALAVPGVEEVIEAQGWPWPSKFQPLGGVVIIARNTGAAIKGRDAPKVVLDD
jgi:hypothetical protein